MHAPTKHSKVPIKNLMIKILCLKCRTLRRRLPHLHFFLFPRSGGCRARFACNMLKSEAVCVMCECDAAWQHWDTSRGNRGEAGKGGEVRLGETSTITDFRSISDPLMTIFDPGDNCDNEKIDKRDRQKRQKRSWKLWLFGILLEW